MEPTRNHSWYALSDHCQLGAILAHVDWHGSNTCGMHTILVRGTWPEPTSLNEYTTGVKNDDIRGL
jgi:hypothetical protein